jgi:hypothetical protein
MSESSRNQDGLTEYWEDLLPGIQIPRMSDDQLREFICGVVDRRIFTIHDIHQRDECLIPAVFMPIIFGPFNHYNPDSLKRVGCVYEYYDKALPRSINGYPCFTSMRLMHAEDWKRAQAAIVAEIERRKNIPI